MMHKSSLFVLPALLAASASAQLADILVYSTTDCGADANNPDLISTDFLVFDETKIVDGNRESTCSYAQVNLPDWPQSNGKYQAYVDQNTIPDDCEVVFFDGAPTDDSINQGACWSFYRRVPSDAKCASLSLGPRFGMSMCCGAEACNVDAGSFPSTPPAKRTIAAPKPARDVTKIKRAAPLQKREECVWDSVGKENIITYGAQNRVSAEVNCGDIECSDAVAVSYSLTTSNSFGTSTEAGVNFFEIMSASVSFETTYTEEHGTTFTSTYTGSRPAGSTGYVTFQPRLECSPKGKFTGDCADGVPTDQEGDACFPMFVGDLPDGRYTFVQTN